MRKYFILLIKLLLLSFLGSQVNAKTLPPGTGGAADVPANVLILLDASGSMGWNTTIGMNYSSVRAIAPIQNTNEIITFGSDNFIRRSDHANNSPVRLHNNREALRDMNANRCQTFNINKNIIYNENKIYFMSTQIRNIIFQYDLVTNTCSPFLNLGWQDMIFPEKFLLHNNHLVAISGMSSRILKINLSNKQISTCDIPNSHLRITMRGRNNINFQSQAQYAIDGAGNLVVFRQFNVPGRASHELYRYNANGTCFNVEPDQTFRGMFNTSEFWQVSGIVVHPADDNIFFATSWDRGSLAKFTTSGVNITNIEVVGRRSGVNSNYNPTNKNQIRFNQPYNITIEPSKSVIYVADFNNRIVQSFDYDLNFAAVSGFRSTQTRMKGAQDAIQSLVTDSALVSSVNFGFGIWSGYQIYAYTRPTSRNGISSIPCREAVNKYRVDWLVRYWWWNRFHCILYGGINGMGPDRLPGYEGWNNNRDKGIPSSTVHSHIVKVERDGAQKTGREVRMVRPMWGTNARFFAMMAKEYYEHPDDSPIDPNADCQASHVIVIGDGDFTSGEAAALQIIKDLNAKQKGKVKTIAIAYGPGISPRGLRSFNQISINGGYPSGAIIASGPAALRARLGDIIRNIQAEKLAFTAPAITATVEEGGNLYQAQFKYRQKKEWQGTLTRSYISPSGEVDENHKDNWEAASKMPSPSQRKIWTPLQLASYEDSGWNNFVDTNSLLINDQFTILGNEVSDYHNDTPTNNLNLGTARCSGSGDSRATIQDGNDDDIKGLINFIRGEDYFDYNSNCILREKRVTDQNTNGYLGDIYHSEMIVVGEPSADTNFTNPNQESYYRSLLNYKQFKDSTKREETIYVGANDGMLHAFKADGGEEKWAFVPPYIAGRLPLVINTALNDNNSLGDKGGSSAIYGVDGSPVAHDMFITHPKTEQKAGIL